jgi:glycosyl transferase family 25
MIPVFVINLRDSVARREHMKREMEKTEIPFTFIEAVSGDAVTKLLGTVTRNQTACALSHLHAIRLIAEGEHDFGAIFEDDILVSPDARLFLDARALGELPHFDIMQLCNIMRRPGLAMTVATVAGRFRICAGPRPSIGMQAAIYHRLAAQRILREITEISDAIDRMLFQRMDVFGLRIVSVRPSVVRDAEFQSTIYTPGPKVRNKVWRELTRGMKCMGRIVSFLIAWHTTVLRLDEPH